MGKVDKRCQVTPREGTRTSLAECARPRAQPGWARARLGRVPVWSEWNRCRCRGYVFSVLLRVGTSRCDVPARVQRAERVATNPRSAPERRGDAAARRPYLAKQV